MIAMSVGTELEPLVIARVAPEPMKVFALLMQDPNPIHWDKREVERLGLGERVVNQGPISVSWLAEIAARAAGGHEAITRFQARFIGRIYEGDAVTCRGKVTQVDGATATVELVAEVDGKPRVLATAEIRVQECEREDATAC